MIRHAQLRRGLGQQFRQALPLVMVAMTVMDYYVQWKRSWLRLHEKGGKQHEMPAHHTPQECMDACIDAGIADDTKGPLFRTAPGAMAG